MTDAREPPTSETIVAPWSGDDTDALNRWQRSGFMHEFTCGNHHDGDRMLFATRQGWVCAHCDYRQNWAHDFMTKPLPVLGRGSASPIRDLILHLDRVAQHHIAYPQVAPAMSHLRDHLSALAFCEETNQREAEGRPVPVYRR